MHGGFPAKFRSGEVTWTVREQTRAVVWEQVRPCWRVVVGLGHGLWEVTGIEEFRISEVNALGSARLRRQEGEQTLV